MSGTYKTVTEWENYLSTLNGPMGKKKRAALLNFVRFGSDGGSEGVGGGKAQAQAVRTPCGPAVSQAVGASYVGGKQQRSLLSKGTGASPAGRHGPPDHDTTMREMASSRGLNPPWRNGVTIASGTKPVQK